MDASAISKLTPLQKALMALERTEARLSAAENRNSEPIAVIGLGCRFPAGGSGPEGFWRVLDERIDARVEVPRNRWDLDSWFDPQPGRRGKVHVRHGAYLERIDEFDADFFGISPKEARSMDPQQRLLLEVCWEALEDAALAPGRLARTRTGVFVGICLNEYMQVLRESGNESASSIYAGTGNGFSFAAGRLSYFFGFQGPCIALDTACSSSLVTVHLACQSLRSRETDMAVAGGVQLILLPETHVMLCDAGALAPDGRCKTFDASANGYGRGEGCGLVVLKRLSDALEAGDPILGLIRGSATNHGGASSGLTVPNGLAQQRVILDALVNARLVSGQVDYVEAHGTGTPLGDPIELRALGAVMGTGRTEPLRIGSVKTNIGHLEGSAGIAGVIKILLALEHEQIPASLHFNSPNPEIPWSQLAMQVVSEPHPWKRGTRPRIAGISSFGISGSNSHVLIQEAPALNPPARSDSDLEPHLLAISGRTLEAVREQAALFYQNLADQSMHLEDFTRTVNESRSFFRSRVAVIASSKAGMQSCLEQVSKGAGPVVVADAAPRLAVVYSGVAPSSHSTWQELREKFSHFRAVLEECRIRVNRLFGIDLEKILPSPAAGLPSEEKLSHLAAFVFEYALGSQWKKLGITPHAIVGHGVGVHSAACVQGDLGLEEGITLAFSYAEEVGDADAEEACLMIPGDSISLPLLKRDFTREMSARKVGLCLVVGPVLQPLQDPSATEPSFRTVFTLPTGRSGLESVLRAAGELFECGVELNWFEVGRERGGRRVRVATYPFQRKRFWVEPLSPENKTRPESGPRFVALEPVPLPLPSLREKVFELEAGRAGMPFLTDHRIFGGIVVPGAFHVSLLLQVAGLLHGDSAVVLEDLIFTSALALSDSEVRKIQTVLSPAESGAFSFEVLSLETPAGCRIHASGRMTAVTGNGAKTGDAATLDALRRNCGAEADVEQFHQGLARRQVQLGPAFRWLQRIWTKPGEALGMFRRPGVVEIGPNGFLHPGLIDSCFQLLGATVPEDSRTMIPFHLGRVRRSGLASTEELWCHVAIQSRPDSTDISGDILLMDATGRTLLEVSGLEVRMAGEQAFEPAEGSRSVFHRAVWTKQERSAQQSLKEIKTSWAVIDSGARRLTRFSRFLPGNVELIRSPDTSEPASNRLGQLLDSGGLTGLIYCLPDRKSEGPREVEDGCREVLGFVQDLLGSGRLLPPVWFVAERADASGELRGGGIHAINGLLAAVRIEHPEFRASSIEIDEGEMGRDFSGLVGEILAGGEGCSEIRLTGGNRSIRKLEAVTFGNDSLEFGPGKTYLITGGLGALGLGVARWLVGQGARSIWLTGRRPPGKTELDVFRLMQQSGASIAFFQADVSIEQDVQRLFDAIRNSGARLAGIFHVAGLLEDAMVTSLKADVCGRVMAPKVAGSWNLHEASRELQLDFFVLYSSAASLLGAAGQAHYAAANAYMNWLAEWRTAQGMPGLSICWGPWDETGMASKLDQRHRERFSQRGIQAIMPEEGLRWLGALIGSRAEGTVMVMPVDWEKFGLAEANPPALVQGLTRPKVRTEPLQPPAVNAGNPGHFHAVPVEKRSETVQQEVERLLGSTLGWNWGHRAEPDRGFSEMGIDSMMAVDFRNQLQRSFGRVLPATVAFKYPTVRTLTDFLLIELFGAPGLKPGGNVRETALEGPATIRADDLENASAQELAEMLERELNGPQDFSRD